MRCLMFLMLVGNIGCGGNLIDCEKGMHRSGEGCAPDRVFGEHDTGDDDDTGV